MTTSLTWQVRPATATDHEFLVDLAQRLTIGVAPWRDPAAVLATMREFLLHDLEEMGPDSTVFIATAPDDTPVGAATIGRGKSFTGEAHAYLGELAVVAEVEGQGAATALLAAVEEWAREQCLGLVVLDTGAANSHARRFYSRYGYAEETVRLAKVL
ncbi:MAG TPA: GNAT family N-acetyltransferase [Ktedonobacterales bacterium]|nr:GNAT family N-acetyltransferase [Ktedonobacterales bacterium]